MKKKIIPLLYAGKKMPYAKAVVVGDLVFCSGMAGGLFETGKVREDDVEVQAVDCLDKIKKILEDAGTSLENIVHMTVYYKDILKDHDKVYNTTILDYFRKHAPSLAEDMPAGMALGVTSLINPSLLVEIEVIAVLPD